MINFCLEEFIKNNDKFVYMRRYSLDMKNFMVERYFANVPGFKVPDITGIDGSYISVKNGELLVSHKEGSKVVNDGAVGYCVALSDIEHYKSLNFPDVKYIIFEEFVTSEMYLSQEVSKLLNFVSTILRNNDGVVFLIANTISNVNPYFREFQFTNIDRQKIGSVDVYQNGDTRCTVWLTAPLDQERKSNKMFFGERGKMINNGEWDRDRKRRLEKNRKEYDLIYTMVLSFGSKCFLMEFLADGSNHIWYVTPKTTPIQTGTRVISNEMVEDDLTTIGFIPLNSSENVIFQIIRQGKVAFSDNLTGTEFKQCVEQLKEV